MNTFAKINPILKRNWFKIVLGLLLIILVDILQLMVPKIMQIAIDKLRIPGFTQSDLFRYSLMIFLIAIGIALIRFLWRLLLIGCAWITDRDLRQLYYDHLLSLSKNFFNRAKTGDLMAYATNDLNAVRMLVGFGLVIIVDIAVFTIASLFFMIRINLRLTLYAILPMPVLTLIIIIFGRKIHYHFKRVQTTFSQLSGIVQESISGIRVIKAFGQEEAEQDKVSQSAYGYVKDNIALVKIFGMFHPFLFLIIAMSMGIVLIFGGEYTMLKEISMGEFIAFFSYLGMFVWPMIAIGWFVNLYQRGTASLNRLNSIFEIEPEVKDENPDFDITGINGKIELKDLHFSYNEGSAIFKGMSFSVNQGETLAVVGRTGCGKTTLIDLITRVYNPPGDSVFIDDHELYEIPLAVLRENIVTVPQEIFLFSDSIADNISLSNPDSERHLVEEAARYAQVYEDIVSFEKGFDTVIGERGVTLSGGQKQRIAIARALLTNPKILILDDALSAVDTKTEKQILDQLITLRRNKTTIIIAHRISALQHADKVIVLDAGNIIETGTHAELLETGGIYRDLYEKQQIEERLKAEDD
ncbi:MAG: ABC transporter ATP-binding protein [Candidatus Cloacimonetes bacterium]|nr:ABC transporter ATP-binding protein [Candidatus Cloacimonadota bacterium]